MIRKDILSIKTPHSLHSLAFFIVSRWLMCLFVHVHNIVVKSLIIEMIKEKGVGKEYQRVGRLYVGVAPTRNKSRITSPQIR